MAEHLRSFENEKINSFTLTKEPDNTFQSDDKLRNLQTCTGFQAAPDSSITTIVLDENDDLDRLLCTRNDVSFPLPVDELSGMIPGTTLKILAGHVETDEFLEVFLNDVSLGYLSQNDNECW